MVMDTKLVDKIIVGRVVPHIYAFSTNTIPNYLKVGDTYRSVEERLNEWKRHFADLTPVFSKEATVNDSVYFRDYTLHKFLVDDKGKTRLVPTSPDFPTGIYYSNEFFKNVTTNELGEGVEDIISDFNNSGNKYEFYDIDKRLPRPSVYAAVDTYKPRPNQKVAIDNFMRACRKGRTNLLMYAVMRFGKSFTSIWCAKEMKAKLVVIVTAKADVEEEWKHTVQSHVDFASYGFVFVTSKDLKHNNNLITECLKAKKKPVVFLTLQDLYGTEIKTKHKELFGENRLIDLLIVDETHFGARAEEYGKVLNESERDINVSDYSSEDVSTEEAKEIYKTLNRKITLHLSGTPYRLLMGSEFSKEDIICFCQFTDVIQEQEKWNKEWLLKDVYDNSKCEEFGKKMFEDVHEWDNPYFGFPKMIRFAFNPNETTQRKLEELKKEGFTFAFSKLFRPKSIKKVDNGEHKVFVHEQEILDLFKAIDGSKEDSNIFPFLNYEKIQNGKMCRHMVIVLPYCASCDALEELFKKYREEFLHLKDYEIINISGVDNTKRYKIAEIIKKIEECERDDKKTITLTVQRMLTGSTVKEWDTMIYLKDTSSPQEYDQAIFRLQNQYVVSALDGKTKETIKIDMKPQTLLVDFAPNRIFYMQEKKAQIYNANVDKNGNSRLAERIKEELRISPIIFMNKEKMEIVEETNILEAISNYNLDKGISEEVRDVSIDLSILDNPLLKAVIDKENEMNSKAGLETKAGDGESQELDTGKGVGKENKENKNDKSDGDQSNSNNTDEPNYAKKIQNFYRRILLFAFLTKNTVVSVDDIINCIEVGDNKRLSSNLGLKKNELKELIKSYKNKFALSSLDYKIQDLNKLTHDSKMSNEEKIKLALSKFGKLGESAVITSFKTCYEMIDLIEGDYYQDCINKGRFIVDIASVSGEFAFALHKKLNSLGLKIEDYKHRIISIPKTNICYELTRKVYEYIGLDIDCISDQINAYELIKPNIKFDEMSKNNIVKQYFPLLWKKMNKEERKMIEFGAIVGNPPYHEIVSKSSGNSSLGKELFPSFIKLSTKLTSRYVSLITPSKWFTSDGQDQSFPALREYIKSNNHIKVLVNFTDNKDIFPDVSLGSVNYFLYDLNHNSGLTKFYEDGNINYTERPLFEHGLDIIFSMNSISDIVNKVLSVGKFESLKSHAKGRNAFGISGKKETVEKETSETPFKDSIEVRCAHEVIRYIAKSKITKNTDVMGHYKIFTSKGNGAAGTLDINSSNYIIGKAYVGKPDSICTDSLIPIGCFDTEEEAINLQTYMKTKFLRYLVGVMKSSRNIYQVVYEFVPVQDFTSKSDIDWTNSVSEIDKQLYKKYKLSGEEIKLVESIIKQMA